MEFPCGCCMKETADQISPSLNRSFNKSFRLVIFPGDWKLANIVPIFKKGKRDFVENYCPISLLPVISKVLERCVLAVLRDHTSHLISPEQHGFLAGRFCVTQLTSVLHCIGGQMDAGKQIDIIYLDMSKVATVHWLTKTSWKCAAPCNKTNLKLPFRCDVTYKTRLQLTNLLPISYWHEFWDIVFFYKAVNNLVFIDSEVLPATRQSTRSTRSSSCNA